MGFAETAWEIFEKSISDYHITDDVDAETPNPYEGGSLEHLLYSKNWIDTVQWHLEDIIRDEAIDPVAALALKRRIDASNQHRTDLVEYIDSWFLQKFQDIRPDDSARINTETPAWAVDRLSILALKIFHMQQEAERTEASAAHREKCSAKLAVLLVQKEDLMLSINQLLADIESGNVRMKVYKQMKMYNDADLNPILYQKR